MKHAIALAVFVAVACLTLSEAGLVPPNGNLQKWNFERAVGAPSKPCKCMNGHLCHGEVNSDIQCSPSYLFVCCVIPDPQHFEDDSGNEIQGINF